MHSPTAGASCYAYKRYGALHEVTDALKIVTECYGSLTERYGTATENIDYAHC